MDPKQLIEKPNTIVFFYMDGCPYCIKSEPYWNELKKKYGKDFKCYKVESKDVDSNLKEILGLSGFPHFLINKNGKKINSSGSKDSLKELEEGLQLSKSSGGTRRRQLLRGRRRRSRKLRNTIRKRT
jgi:thiol-disulfide isomerase/thioredoxin